MTTPQTILPKKLLAVLVVFGALSILPFRHFPTAAERPAAVPPSVRFENYDIRTERDERAVAALAPEAARIVERQRKSAARAAGELRARVPNLRVEYDDALGIPEIVATENGADPQFLTGPSSQKRAVVLGDFLKRNAALFGLAGAQIDDLETTADYANPDGRLAFVRLEQSIDGVPVFRGELTAGFTARGELVRIVNNLAPDLDESPPPKDFGRPERAVEAAAAALGRTASDDDLKPVAEQSNEREATFARGQFSAPTTAAKIYFPLAAGAVAPAWRVLLWTNTDAYYVIVDARTGTLLWRKNITNYQTLPATYSVYGNATSLARTADSPTAFTPGCATPLACPEPSIVGRQTFTLVGREAPYTFNNLGWIPDDGLPVRMPADNNVTDGNAVEAGPDRDGTQGVDAPAPGSPNRVFDFVYNPAPGAPPPGDAPLGLDYQRGSSTQIFYALNRWHDELYLLGFNEQARNFQHFNFGRGGLEGDRISAEIQDSSGTNGANMATPADGARPRLQMYIWTGTTPNRDGALDNHLVLHEMTHGLSNRLHGNSAGLSTAMAVGMGEGWSDFYALALLSEPADALAATYPIGAYAPAGAFAGGGDNYYGLRRFPTAVKSFVGANGLPHNPLTFGNLNQGSCGTFNSAFPPRLFNASNCAQPIYIGEVWAAALWEVRARLVARLGWAEGNRKALQFTTDGMKLAPLNPTLLQERDAIVAAAQAGGTGTDAADVRAGFAIRGLGFSAQITSTNPLTIAEAFDEGPNARLAPGFSASDAPGNNNGVPERGEALSLVVPVVNPNGATVPGVTVQVGGGGTAVYGDIAPGQTVTRSIAYTFPADVCAASAVTLTFQIGSPGAGTRTERRRLHLGVPGGVGPTFANPTPVTIADNGPAVPYGTSINVAGVTTGSKPRLDLAGLSHTYPADIDLLLVGPNGQTFEAISDQGGGVDLVNVSLTLSDDADGLLPSTITPGIFNPTADATAETFPAPAPSGPYNLPGPGGGATFASVFGSQNPNGAWTLYITDDATPDSGALAGGWSLTFEPPVYLPICLSGTRSDFDGDGKADVAVFRPAEGNWYLNRSTAGFTVANWGIATDRPVPGDYDGDGRTDVAVFRPNADSAQPDFYILNSGTLSFAGVSWGLPGDLPAIGDYDGDGRDDLAVFRPSDHTFYVLKSTGGVQTFAGIAAGLPVAGDYDSDGKGDFAAYHVDGWYIALSGANYAFVNFTRWGLGGDLPVAADYDGDGRDDLAVFRPSDGVWYINGSAAGNLFVAFGLAADVPVPADYDGDGRADVAVFRNGTWYVNRSANGLLITQFGLGGDRPLPNAYLP